MNTIRTVFMGCSYVGILLVTSLYIPYVYAQSLQVISWNVESGDSATGVLVEFIQDQQGIDLWGFVEVQNEEWATLFEDAAAVGEGADFASVLGTTGQEDRLLVVYNSDILEVVNSFELPDINILGRVRAPLVVHFKVRETNREFLFMVNHLYRSKADARARQAQMLNEWVRSQPQAVIAVGDYNFDWNVEHGEQNHDVAYDHLTQNDVLVWLRPEPLLATHCGSHNSVLDFVFYSEPAREWAERSEILQAQRDYCPDNHQKSDHRPLLAEFQLDGGEGGSDRTDLLREINEHLSSIEEELGTVRDLLKQLDQQ